MRIRLATLAALGLGACARTPAPLPAAHYVVGAPYQAAGVWHYPREQFDYDDTGVATLMPGRAGRTADGEAADADAMAAAHATLQLPAIAEVTDLDNGFQIVVRVNDRIAIPGRIIALTPHAMALLQADTPTPRVRVQVLQAESLRAASDAHGGAATLALAAAPMTDVQQEMLPLPPGAQGGQGHALAAKSAPAALPSPAPVPLRLPDTVTRVAPQPGGFYVEAAALGHLNYARMLSDRLASLGAQVSTSYDAPRELVYRVRIGPLPTVAAADAMLARVIRAGVTGARIVAE